MEPLLVEAFRYNKWANLHLLDACLSLSDAQLRLTAAGTYGTIADTWLHLLGAEQRYIRRIAGIEARIGEDTPFPGIAALKREAVTTGDQLIEIAGRLKGDEQIEPARLRQYTKLSARVVLLQALHHGNDHRTHICTILGSHGVDYGDMDVWAYGRATGEAVEGAPAC